MTYKITLTIQDLIPLHEAGAEGCREAVAERLAELGGVKVLEVAEVKDEQMRI